MPYYDPTNLDTCQAFIDVKKKLRIVLASADIDSINHLNSTINFNQYLTLSQQLDQSKTITNPLNIFLRLQLYEAIAVQDRDLQAQLYETLRSIQQFTDNECKEILRSMIDDYRSRSVYIAYLVKNHENLLNISYHQERLVTRIQRYVTE